LPALAFAFALSFAHSSRLLIFHTSRVIVRIIMA
jgi:hypothetical protein